MTYEQTELSDYEQNSAHTGQGTLVPEAVEVVPGLFEGGTVLEARGGDR